MAPDKILAFGLVAVYLIGGAILIMRSRATILKQKAEKEGKGK